MSDDNAFRVRLLGRFCLSARNKTVQFPARKAESLFAFLVLNRNKPTDRSVLAGMFWPDFPDSRARRNLSTALWRMKGSIYDQIGSKLQVSVGGDYILLCLDNAEIDVMKFRGLLDLSAKQQREGRIATMRQAEALYTGDLLEDCSDEWCEEERRYLRGLYLGLLRDLVTEGRRLGDYGSAISFAQKAITINPLDEDIQGELMCLFHLSGKRTAALAQYEALKKLLEDELGVQPSAQTRELRQQILSDDRATSKPSSLLRAASELPGSDQFARISIVGREAHFGALVRLVESVSRGTGVGVIVSGEAGVGKTKLVEALSTEAEYRGLEVLHGECPDVMNPPPYQAFVQALWPRLSALEQLGYDTSSPIGSLIRNLVPAALCAPDRLNGSSNIPFDNAIVNEAILRLLVDSSARPTLLVLENIHRVDKASEGLLIGLSTRLAKSRLFIVATARANEGEKVGNLLSTLVRNGAIKMELPRLSGSETKMLVLAALRTKSVSSSVIDYVWQKSAGNPLFILEFVKLLYAEGSLTSDLFGHWRLTEATLLNRMPMPLRVQEVIRRRIEILDASSRNVLFSAGVLGVEVDFDILRQFTNLSEEDLIRNTDRLVRQQLLEETPKGFKFTHENVRVVALEMVSRNRIRIFHLRAGDLKERETPWRTEDLAWHFSEAGELERALNFAESSGDKARSVHANDDAAKWYARALEILGTISDLDRSTYLRRRLALLVRRHDTLERLGDREEQAREIEAIEEAARELDDQSACALAMHLRANLMIRLNATEAAIHTADCARKVFHGLGDLREEARSCVTIGLAYENLRRYDLETSNLERALSLFRQVHDRRGEATVLLQLGRVRLAESNYLEALECFALAEQPFREFEDHRSIAYLLIGRGVVYRFLGKTRLSESMLLSGLEILTKIGDRVGEARALTQLSATHVALGKLREAVHETRRALRLASATKDRRAQILILNNTGVDAYRCVGDFKRGKTNVAKALTFVAESADKENLAIYQDSMAAILLDEGNAKQALHWSKLSWASSKSGKIGEGYRAEIQFRLGCAYLELGDRRVAERYLHRSLVDLIRSKEIPLQIRTMTALSRVYLEANDIENAMKYARVASRLLRKVDGIEQVQQVYWTEFRALRAAGAHGAAETALQKAHEEVLKQSLTLRGRMKLRFLNEVKINRLVLDLARESR